MLHRESSPLAGQTVKIKKQTVHPQVPNFGGSEIWIEDWWDKVSGRSWMYAKGNPACLVYAMRTGFAVPPISTDDEVLYGKIDHFGHLVHISELEL